MGAVLKHVIKQEGVVDCGRIQGVKLDRLGLFCPEHRKLGSDLMHHKINHDVLSEKNTQRLNYIQALSLMFFRIGERAPPIVKAAVLTAQPF